MNILALKNNKKSKQYTVMGAVFKTLQVISGLNYGFFQFEWAIANILVKLLTFAVYIMINYLLLHFFILKQESWSLAWFLIHLVKYAIYFLFLILLKTNNSFRSFHDELNSVDSKFGVESASFNVEIKLLTTCCVFGCVRVFINVSYCLYAEECFKPIVIGVIYIIMTFCVDILIISYAFVFFAVQCRLKKLSLMLENEESGFSVLQNIYILYVDVVEKYKGTFDLLLIIVLLFSIPEVMCSIYFSLDGIWNHGMTFDAIVMVLTYSMVVTTLLMVFTPAICASMLSSEADHIILVLHDKLFKQRDEVQIRDIERFIGYVEARSCRFRVYKVIPLDTDLLGMVLGFCATYLIVIIQFTKTY